MSIDRRMDKEDAVHIYSAIKKQNNVICSNMDATWDYHTKWSINVRLHQPNTFLNPCRGLHHDIPSSLCDFIPYNATCTRFQPEGLPCGTTLLPASGLTVPFALDAVSPVCMAPFSFHPSSAQTSHHYSWSILCPSNIEQHPPCITCLLTVGKCANRTREGDRQVGDGVRVNINTSL